MSISEYNVDTAEKKITITISASTEFELSEYLIQIYEDYGIVNGNNDLSRWMTSSPVRNNISMLVMEVTVYYA